MSMTYTDWALRVVSQLPAPGAENVDFSVVLPAAIDHAEKRIYRELDLLWTTYFAYSTLSTTTNYVVLTQPTGATFTVVQSVNVLTPAGVAPRDLGVRRPLAPVTRDYIYSVYGSSAGSGVPRFFTNLDTESLLVGPWPDQAYEIEVIGNARPAALSESNDETILTQMFPDLFFAASMSFVAQAVGAYGADIPGGAEKWEATYQLLRGSAAVEEARKKFAFGDWAPTSTSKE